MRVLTARPNDHYHRRKKYSAHKALHSLISSKGKSHFFFLLLFLLFFFSGEGVGGGGVVCIITRNLQCNFISKEKTFPFKCKQCLERCSKKRTRNFELRHFTPTPTVFMMSAQTFVTFQLMPNYVIIMLSHSHQSDLFLKGFKIDSLGYVCLI